MYNAITRGIEPELIPACRKYKLDIVIYNPLAGGLFSGKIKSKDHLPQEGRFGSTAEKTLADEAVGGKCSPVRPGGCRC